VNLLSIPTVDLLALHAQSLAGRNQIDANPAKRYNQPLSVYAKTADDPVGYNLDELVCLFALSLEQGLFLEKVYQKLLDGVRNGWHPSGSASLYEVAWLVFSQKNWDYLKVLLRSQLVAELPDNLRGHLSDLFILATYRSISPTINRGQDTQLVRQVIQDAIRVVVSQGDPGQSRTRLYNALLTHILGGFSEARAELFAVAQDLQPQTILRSVASIRPPLDPESGSAFTDRIPSVKVVRRHQEQSVFLVSLDRAYFDLYFDLFLASLKSHSTKLPLHLHCIGFDPEDDLRRLQIHNKIGYSLDNTDLSEFSSDQKRAYFASARLLHAAMYLDLYSGLYICDIDGAIAAPISGVLSETAKFDVASNTSVLDHGRRLFRLPWESIFAGNLALRSTKGGVLFARYLNRYLSSVLFNASAHQRSAWFCDQNALFYGWADLREHVVFSPLSDTLFRQALDWRLSTDGNRKLEFMKKRSQSSS